MQLSAGPALPHTRARPVHWMTTAAVLAAVIGAGAMVQPADAAPHGRKPPLPIAPDPAAAVYPLDCAGSPVTVVGHVSGDLDADGRPETVAVVRCYSETGTPPSGVYVLAGPDAPGGRPRIAGTLVDPKDQRAVTDLRLRAGTVSATVLGYSSQDTPRCCPDLRHVSSWRMRAGRVHVIPGGA